MGFCVFNNIAIGARYAQKKHEVGKVLIVDWDVHHGNGTQDAFLDDPSVFFLSLHQWPHYPGSGAEHERGVGAGEGFTLNVPIPAGTSAVAYRDRFDRALSEVEDRFAPDFVLVSAGFDCMAGDPLGDLLLEPGDLHWMTRRVAQLAERACHGRMVALLEGGYAPPRLGAGAVAVIRGLAELDVPSA
jgi:acetoin utilization deacetylase AcuC-like enzyme